MKKIYKILVASERKLALRSTVTDRIKTDFLSRYPNKLIVLHEPTRDTPKSREETVTFEHFFA